VIAAHDVSNPPRMVYATQAALDLWEMDWGEFVSKSWGELLAGGLTQPPEPPGSLISVDPGPLRADIRPRQSTEFHIRIACWVGEQVWV